MVFPGVQKSTWSHDRVAKRWYFHRFYDFQPDLNTSNPEVQAEILKIMGFWIQLGVSGFRMDAVPFVIGTKGAEVDRPREQYDMLRSSANSCNGASATRSSWRKPSACRRTDMEYFGDAGDRMHMMFNFQVNQNLFYAMASGDTRPLVKAMETTKTRPASGQWGMFLRNHDELDLGRLTRGATANRVRSLRSQPRGSTLQARHPSSAGADARRRPPPHRACLQPHVHAAGYAGRSLWR